MAGSSPSEPGLGRWNSATRAAGIALDASAWIDQRLGVVVMFAYSSHPASKEKTT